MKGTIFKEFEKLVRERFGEDTLEQLYVDAGIPEEMLPFVSVATYDDKHLYDLVAALSARSGIPGNDLVRVFGRQVFGALARGFPMFLKGHTDPIAFLDTVDRVIHVEVKKLDAGADLPMVVLDRSDGVRLRYRSHRKLCPLLEGLVLGVGDWFQRPATFAHEQCMHDGAAECVLKLEFGAAA